VQRWGSEQAARSSVMLRTASLMSLASLGTAGLVLCGSLAVGGPSGSGFSIALGNGPAAVTDGASERSEVVAAPAGRSAGQPTARRSSRLADRPDPVSAPVDRRGTSAGGAVSGTTTAAAMTPADADLDSVGHPARSRSVVRSSALQPAAPTSLTDAAPSTAVPAPPAPGSRAAARPAVVAPTVTQAPVAQTGGRPGSGREAVGGEGSGREAQRARARAEPAAKPAAKPAGKKPAAVKAAGRPPAPMAAAPKAAAPKAAARRPRREARCRGASGGQAGQGAQAGQAGQRRSADRGDAAPGRRAAQRHHGTEPPGQARADEPKGNGDGGNGDGGNGDGPKGDGPKGDATKDHGASPTLGKGNGSKH
jgi:hypothetical protein